MASTKLPPRQQMINMMYLVLTAMLAMNVSKEVLDAFAIMDAELVRSEQAHAQRSQLEYAVFADAAARFPEKFGATHAQALRVKAQADSLVQIIERTKTEAIAQADGLSAAMLRGADAQGRDTLRALLALDAKDDREVLTRMLVGPEPAAPHQGPGGAYELKQRIGAFRDSLKLLVAGRGPELSAALDLLFDHGDRRDASGTLNNWESINFYDVPLAAGIATLSKLQADIRSAENDMVKWLYRSVEAADYKFGTLTTAVIPQTNLVMAGDSFRADVFLAAYDPRNAPTVTLAGGGPLPVGTDGKAKLRLRADQVGEQRVEGMIRFEGPKGVEEIPYSTTYQVMAPLLVASPTKMNVLYRGVDNPIELSVPGVSAERVQAVISTGRIVRSGQGWVASGMTGNTAEVFATVTMPDGSSRRVGPMRFRVKDLPPPLPIVAGKTPRDNRIRKAELMAAQGIVARMVDTDFEAPWLVKRFKIVAVRGARVVEMESTSNTFTPQMRDLIADLRPGEQVFFEEIKAQLASGAGPVTPLPSMAFRVVQ
ncbi:MAG: gliding motility protein GldM [Flavobacteriales bacterium]|nr:gliding motility protein GldM [Flavobacteriales bacterium]